MTWSNMAWADLLTRGPTEPEDYGFFLSLHTEATPSNTNELDPAMVPGYSRVPSQYSGNEPSFPGSWFGYGQVANAQDFSTVEWALKLGRTRQVTNASAWPSPFSNKGGDAWPAVKSVALNAGPDAAVPRNSVSFRASTITLGQDWVLAAGEQGLPPDNIRDFSIEKPNPFSRGGLYGSFRTPYLSPGNIPFLTIVGQILSSNFFIQREGQTSSRQNTPDDRKDMGAIARVAFALALLDDADFPESGGFKTGSTPTGFNGMFYNGGSPLLYDPNFRAFPIMALSSDRTKLENKNDVPINATAAVSAGSGYWALYDASHNQRQTVAVPQWAPRGTNTYPWISRSYGSLQGVPCLYGPIDSSAPALAVGEGVIPAGAISITL